MSRSKVEYTEDCAVEPKKSNDPKYKRCSILLCFSTFGLKFVSVAFNGYAHSFLQVDLFSDWGYPHFCCFQEALSYMYLRNAIFPTKC